MEAQENRALEQKKRYEKLKADAAERFFLAESDLEKSEILHDLFIHNYTEFGAEVSWDYQEADKKSYLTDFLSYLLKDEKKIYANPEQHAYFLKDLTSFINTADYAASLFQDAQFLRLMEKALKTFARIRPYSYLLTLHPRRYREAKKIKKEANHSLAAIQIRLADVKRLMRLG